MELRPYQQLSIEALNGFLARSKEGHPLVVAPTGSGKSVMLAAFIKDYLTARPTSRLTLLAHRKELLQQNAEKLIRYWPEVSLGVYSAGLDKRQLGRKVTVAGIQSVFKKADGLGVQDLLLIDEAHLTPPDGEGMYRTLIAGLMRHNPLLRVVGFTATPFRLSSGLLTDDGGLFTDIAFEISVKELIDQGYLAKLVSKCSVKQADLSTVKVRAGEFVAKDLEAVMDDTDLTQAAISEIERFCGSRKSWLVFCSGVEHAQHFAEALRERGHPAECVVGDTPSLFRAHHIQEFKAGRLKCLVNCNVYTEGFDAPNVDLIALLRPTQSVGLYVQMVGRGCRPFDGKENCLVLDFGGNIERHGPIDCIKVVRRKNPLTQQVEGTVSTAPVKVCPICRTVCITTARTCGECGYEFPGTLVDHDPVASAAAILSEQEQPKRLKVNNVDFRRHQKTGSPDSFRVVYFVAGFKQISEWVCLEHVGFARSKALQWWVQNAEEPLTPPQSVEEALERKHELKRVHWIEVKKDGQYDRIVARGFEELLDPEEEEARKWLEEQGVNF